MAKGGIPNPIDLTQEHAREQVLAILRALQQLPEDERDISPILRRHAGPTGTYAKSQLLGAYRDDKDPRETLNYVDDLAKITPEVVQEAAQTFFDTGNYVQISLFPEEMQER